jgi:simple sugar transport system permease protein
MKRFAPLFIAAVTALLVCALLLTLAGQNPLTAAQALVAGAVGTPIRFAESLAKTIPLLFTGLSVVIAFRAGFFNIGAEGQFLMGALAASAVATRTTSSWPLVLLSATFAGALWALIAGC